MKLVRYSAALALALAALAAVPACSGPNKADESVAEPVEKVTQAATSANVFHSTWSGGGATGSASGQFSQLNFDVWESKTQQGRRAFLSFFGYGTDPTSRVCVDETVCKWSPMGCEWETIQYCYYTRYYWQNGYGEIPSADFRVGPNSARLTTNLANDPLFNSTRCTYDSQTWTTSCAPATGSFDVTWRANGMSSSDSQGTTSNSYQWFDGSFSTRNVGQWSQDSADVSGTVLGDAASGWGWISQSKGVNVSRDIFKNTGTADGGTGGGKDASLD
jgi:hypothetical protein